MEDQQKRLMLSLLAYAAQRDLSVERICRLSNITMADLNDAAKPLSKKQINDIWLNAMQLSGDSLFGLHFGESLQLVALGVVGEVIKSSRTVGEAISIAASLVHLITADFNMQITAEEDVFTIHFVPVSPDWQQSPVALQMLHLLMVFTIHELDGLLLQKIRPLAFCYGLKTEYAKELNRVARCEVSINAGIFAIDLNKTYWNEPIITANYELQQALLQKIAPETNKRPKGETFQGRIYNYLMANSYLGMVSLEDIAANFDMSARTMQRKLKQESVNFQQITDEVRKNLAISYLKAGNVPLKQVSYLLGYNELSAFTRTFKRWMGITPGQYMSSQSAQ
ncbi:AraC family transcriptional regulator ligand-binding domain-containing protein [Mucilaginibacter sp. X5P1]|uniref:AraC family transcriptional regulator n=1 Tax=Mucilaginibacter sp. X5P1 TaxID=2723088 RepID=UPI00161329A9|nr:AraC family transcriptional regulator [Mucilaginibacter sp. X5P1]MBB6137965.1 AraC-like DNA-binding protein [Mucilaginibacter sp. X5P1]